jgi:hypothetical protein
MVQEGLRDLADNRLKPPQGHERPVMAASSSPVHLFSHRRPSSEYDGGNHFTEVREDNRARRSGEPQKAQKSWSSPSGDAEVPHTIPTPPRILITPVPRASDAQQHAETTLREDCLGIDLTEGDDDPSHEMSSSARSKISDHRTNAKVMEYVHNGIDYARECYLNGTNARMTRRFEIPLVPSASATLTVLRKAALEGLVKLIWTTARLECYEVCFRPPPVYGYPYATIAEPHWWVGRSAGEIKAGPMASTRAVREAEAAVRRKEGRRSAAAGGGKSPVSAAQRRINDKLEEGLRRQAEGLTMHGSDGEEPRED